MITTNTPNADSDGRRWGALTICALISGAIIIEMTKLNLALPSIEIGLNAGPTGLQLVAAGYIMAFALSLIPSGWLGDRGHQRSMMLIGLGIYTAASTAATFTASIELLVLWRIIQGCAAGMVVPQCLATVQRLFSGADRARAFGYYGIAISVAVAAGPLVGGLLTSAGGERDGWRWAFGMNIPLGILLLVLTLLIVPKLSNSGTRRSLDGLGLVLLGFALLLALTPIVLTTGRAGDDPRRWWLLALALAPAIAFVLWERYLARSGRTPLLDPALLRLPSFRNGVGIALTWFTGSTGMSLVLVLLLQLRFELGPAAAGLLTLPAALAGALSAWIAARFVMAHGRTVTVIGSAIAIVGTVATLVVALTLTPATAIVCIALTQVFVGFGSGMIFSPNHTMTLADVPKSSVSMAGSLSQLAQRVGSSIGVAVSAAIFFGIVFGATHQLHGASPAVYNSAFLACTLFSVVLMCAVVFLALSDRRRQRGANSEHTD